ncbi:hypothetical protein V8Z86_22290 [Aeromonas salmonicida subsp. salmonicida]|uniref:hypothetical protein n=1 Tax=Aeromonas salmonicida TaxID=645 RepID=UPI003FD3C1AC
MKTDSDFLKRKSSETDSLLSSFGVSTAQGVIQDDDSLVGKNQVSGDATSPNYAGAETAKAIDAVPEIDPMDVARELMGEDLSAGWIVGGVVEKTEQTFTEEQSSVTEQPQDMQLQRSDSVTDGDEFLLEITPDASHANNDVELNDGDVPVEPPLESIHAESGDRQKSTSGIFRRLKKARQPALHPSTEHEPVSESTLDHDQGDRYERYDTDPVGGRTIAAAYVSLALGVFSFGLASYTFLSLPKNQNIQQIFDDLRTEMVARMDKIESNSVNRTSEIDAAVGEVSRHVQQQAADLSALNSELSSLKSSTEKLSTDTDLGLTWARQTRQLVDNIQESVDALRVSQEASQAAINKLKNTGHQAISQTTRTAESHYSTTKTLPVRKPQLAKVVDGHTLFDVDDWGGILLVTMINGDDVKRLQVGDEIGMWRLESADRQSRQAVFIQGDKVLTVVASGGY